MINKLYYTSIEASKLPCGLFYPQGMVIIVYPCSVREIDAYSSADESNYLDVSNRLDDILKNHLEIRFNDNSVGSIDILTESDRLYLLFEIREFTFQQAMFLTLPKECVCKNMVDIELKRSNFKFYVSDEKLQKFYNKKTKTLYFKFDNEIIELSVPSYGMLKSFIEYMKVMLANKEEVNTVFMDIMPYLLVHKQFINVDDVADELIKFESMPIKKFLFIKSVVHKMKFGIEKLRRKCSKDICGEFVEVDMPDVTERQIFSLFQLPYDSIVTNKMYLQYGKFVTAEDIDNIPFHEFEEKIKIANKIIEERDKKQKSEEDKQKSQMPNMPNLNSISSGMNSMANKFKI
jgi:hypothetical protein